MSYDASRTGIKRPVGWGAPVEGREAGGGSLADNPPSGVSHSVSLSLSLSLELRLYRPLSSPLTHPKITPPLLNPCLSYRPLEGSSLYCNFTVQYCILESAIRYVTGLDWCLTDIHVMQLRGDTSGTSASLSFKKNKAKSKHGRRGQETHQETLFVLRMSPPPTSNCAGLYRAVVAHVYAKD
ncbi:hypothetical protein BX600DRAFT_288485 [Xylariales sp. PMI_506]|nr:hypothetical protein BX600DRAFT_288485 [Xylariales sp. PMI_506]